MPQNKLPVIECNFKSVSTLYLSYMPFVSGGGLFTRTSSSELVHGDKVTLSVQLLDEVERYLVEATVVWKTPDEAQENKPAGIGFQFVGENARQFRNKIETCLAGMLKSTNPTDTM